MIEIIAIFFFSKKIREICEEKGVKAGKWIALLVGAWFGSEVIVIVGGMILLGLNEDGIFQLIIPALIVAIASAFLVLNRVKAIDAVKEDLELDEFAAKDDEFKHFR